MSVDYFTCTKLGARLYREHKKMVSSDICAQEVGSLTRSRGWVLTDTQNLTRWQHRAKELEESRNPRTPWVPTTPGAHRHPVRHAELPCKDTAQVSEGAGFWLQHTHPGGSKARLQTAALGPTPPSSHLLPSWPSVEQEDTLADLSQKNRGRWQVAHEPLGRATRMLFLHSFSNQFLWDPTSLSHYPYPAGNSQTRPAGSYYTKEVRMLGGASGKPLGDAKSSHQEYTPRTHSNEANQSEDKFKPHHHTTWGMRGSMQAQLQPHPLTQE